VKATKDHLLAPRIEHGTVTVDGYQFEIRPLSRKQQIMVQETRERGGLAPADALLLHLGMVDPAMTLEEAEAWQDTDGQADAASAVSEGIGRISGMMPDSGKAAYKSVREQSGS
jgi:hypothetical protein